MYQRRLLLGGYLAGLVACCQSGGTDAGSDAGSPRHVILDAGGTVDAPDGPSACPPGACNYQTQEGCAPDLACRPDLEGSALVPQCEAAGSASEGESCSQSTDCARGLICIEKEQQCRRLCCGGDWTACSPSQSCTRPLSAIIDDAAVSSQAMVCYPVGDCDVLDSSACGKDNSCYIVDERGFVACAPTGTAQLGQPCDESVPCAPLHVCNRKTGTCDRLCRAVEGAPAPACPLSTHYCVHFANYPAGVGRCASWPLDGSEPAEG